MSLPLLLLLAIPYVALGAYLTAMAYRLPNGPGAKVLLGSLVAALFFSVSILFGGFSIVPIPTLALIVMSLLDAVHDLFSPDYDPSRHSVTAYLLVPFLIQWPIWFGIIAVRFMLKESTENEKS